MAVLMIAEVPNMTEEIYGGMVAGLKPQLQAADGFVSHAGGAEPGRRLARRRGVGVRGRLPKDGSRRT